MSTELPKGSTTHRAESVRQSISIREIQQPQIANPLIGDNTIPWYTKAMSEGQEVPVTKEVTSEVHEEKYPFLAGEKGIPFHELLDREQQGEYSGKFKSGSGKELRYIIAPHHISIEDPENPEYVMDASNDGRVAEFNLRTRLPVDQQESDMGGSRHPDMFAGDFIGFALQYFNKSGIKIETCRGIWSPTNSDNFDTFRDEYREHNDKLKAAKATWSAKTFAKYGYTEIGEDSIKIRGSLDDKDTSITADFTNHEIKESI